MGLDAEKINKLSKDYSDIDQEENCIDDKNKEAKCWIYPGKHVEGLGRLHQRDQK